MQPPELISIIHPGYQKPTQTTYNIFLVEIHLPSIKIHQQLTKLPINYSDDIITFVVVKNLL